MSDELRQAIERLESARSYAAKADTDEDVARDAVDDARDDLLLAIGRRLLGP